MAENNENQPIDEIPVATSISGAQLLGIADNGETKLFNVTDIKGDGKGLALADTVPVSPVLSQYYFAKGGVTYTNFLDSEGDPITIPSEVDGKQVVEAKMVWNGTYWEAVYTPVEIELSDYIKVSQINAFPFSFDAINPETPILTLEQIKEFIVDLTIIGTDPENFVYGLNGFRRNDPDSGYNWWGFQIVPYHVTTQLPENPVGGYSFFSNNGSTPESGNEIDIYELSDFGTGSGISGSVAIRWSTLDNGDYFNDNTSFSPYNGYELDGKVFEKYHSGIILNNPMNTGLVLPSKIQIAGREFNAWHHNLLPTIDGAKTYSLEVSGHEYFTKRANSIRLGASTSFNYDFGTLTVKIIDANRKLVEQKSTHPYWVAKNNGSGTKQVMFVGDSLTADGQMMKEIKDLFTADGGGAASFIGTKEENYGTRHEGRSGCKWQDFVQKGVDCWEVAVSGITYSPSGKYTQGNAEYLVQYRVITAGSGKVTLSRLSGSDVLTSAGVLTKSDAAFGDAVVNYTSWAAAAENSFWNVSLGRNDFLGYCSRFGFSGIDIAPIQLGINDSLQILLTEPNYSSIIDNAKTFIDQLLDDYPSAKIIVGLPPIGSISTPINIDNKNLDSFKRKMTKINQLYIDNFDNASYGANVEVCGAYLWLDRENGYPSELQDRSDRNPEVDEVVQLDSVHPKTSGYMQLADAYYSHIRSLFS